MRFNPLTIKFSNCVVRHNLYSISSYLLHFSPVEQANIFSDQVVLFRAWANETHLKCTDQLFYERVCIALGIESSVSLSPSCGVTIVYRLPYRRQ